MASRDGTLIVRPNVSLIDAAGNSWFLKNGQVYQNGKVDPFTSRVIAIGYVNGVVVQENADKLWWAKTGKGYGGWGTPGNSDGHIVNPFGPGSYYTSVAFIIQGSTAPLIDRTGNLWWIDNGKVVQNGVPDRLTSGVIAMTIGPNGEIYQQNSQHLWWQKTYQGYGGWGTPGTPDGHITFDPMPWWYLSAPLWVGGSDNDASKAQNWSNGTVPVPAEGTTGYMIAGTMNVSGKVLDGVTIGVSGTSGSSQDATINLSGETQVRVVNDGLPGYGSTTINLAADAKWIGGFNAGLYGSGMTVQGVGKFANTLSYASNQPAVVVNADVVGTGTFYISSYRGAGKMEFMRSVSTGQAVNVDTGLGYAGGGLFSTVQVDNPKTFDASVQLGYGEVILKSLQADSYAFKNDLLSMYKSGGVVDTVPLSLIPLGDYGMNGARNFGVSQIDNNVVLHATNNSYGGTLLPQIA